MKLSSTLLGLTFLSQSYVMMWSGTCEVVRWHHVTHDVCWLFLIQYTVSFLCFVLLNRPPQTSFFIQFCAKYQVYMWICRAQCLGFTGRTYMCRYTFKKHTGREVCIDVTQILWCVGGSVFSRRWCFSEYILVWRKGVGKRKPWCQLDTVMAGVVCLIVLLLNGICFVYPALSLQMVPRIWIGKLTKRIE